MLFTLFVLISLLCFRTRVVAVATRFEAAVLTAEAVEVTMELPGYPLALLRASDSITVPVPMASELLAFEAAEAAEAA